MKILLYFLPIFSLILACTPKSAPLTQTTDPLPAVDTTPVAPVLATFADTISYVQGAYIAQQIMDTDSPEGYAVDVEKVRKGMADQQAGNALFDQEQMRTLLTRYQTEMNVAMKKKKEAEQAANRKAGEDYLKANALKEGVMTTASGLQYKVLQEGTGASPMISDQVEVHYEGRLIDGTVFDSSYQRGETTTFGVGQVISGWTEGLQLMKEGAKYQFFIPAKLAYGDRGAGAKIGPGATLIFDVELIKVVK